MDPIDGIRVRTAGRRACPEAAERIDCQQLISPRDRRSATCARTHARAGAEISGGVHGAEAFARRGCRVDLEQRVAMRPIELPAAAHAKRVHELEWPEVARMRVLAHVLPSRRGHRVRRAGSRKR